MAGDTIERPQWLTANYIEETLRTRKGFESVAVLDSSVHLAVGKGENYSGLLYRVFISFKRHDADRLEETRFVIKTLPPIEFLANYLIGLKVFERETAVLQDVIPAMTDLLKEKAPDREYQPFSAHCYISSRPYTLILEDLTSLGCKLVPRHSRLDLTHSIIAVKGLARFHATSAALNIANPSLLDSLRTESVFTEENKMIFMGFISSMVGSLINVVKSWTGFEKYSGLIQAAIPTLYDRLKEVVEPKKDAFNVLLHGDCWINNMLFHYSQNNCEVDGVRIIDFQQSRFSSPALDLQYFMYTSPNEEVRLQKLDFLLEEYHKELVDMMKIFGLDPEQYTLEQLKKEFEEKALNGFIAASAVLPAVLVDPEDAFDWEGVKEDGSGMDNAKMENVYAGKRFREAFQNLLPHFHSKGVI